MHTWVFKVARNRATWRTVELLDNQSLHHLHSVIQDAFGWDDDHLYAFFMTNKAWDRYGEYGHPVSDMRSAAKARLKNLGLQPKQKFLYIFDFGDEIRHQITVIDQRTQEPDAKYPRILQVHGEAPPQYGELEDEQESPEL